MEYFEDVFLESVEIPKERERDCWVWSGFFYRKAAVVRLNGQRRVARHISWEMEKGPLAPRTKIYSTCRNIDCVNPYHCDLSPPKRTSVEEFNRHVTMPVDIAACWEWTGRLGKNGVPEFFADGRAQSARVFSMKEQLGHEDTKLKHYKPRCGNPRCVSPEHLVTSIPFHERFWGLVDKEPTGQEGCWMWTGASRVTKRKNGGTSLTGFFQMEGETRRSFHANRIAWMLCGKPSLGNLYLYSTCGNQLCVNPDHREKDHIRVPPPPKISGNDHPASKLTQRQIPAIVRLIDSGMPDTQIGAKYKVSNVCIRKIRIGKTWKAEVARARKRSGSS